jgi:3-hydroxyisobutyrate dehydrogenase-like beta-hydroxyacid dehydrogenase
MSTIGFIGLGAMGSAIAGRLLDQGHDLIVWNRSPEPVDALVARGAEAARTPAEALGNRLSISMLANDEATEAVLTADRLRAAAGATHVCMASISPGAADRLSALCAQHDVTYVAAPVLGRPEAAASGDLNILAAGPTTALDELQTLFALAGKRTWRLGTNPRHANLVKIAVNYNIIHALQAMAESITLVEAHDGSGTDFVELLHDTLFGGVVYGAYGALIAERRYTPAGFALPHGLKDLRLAQAAAVEAGLELPTAPLLEAIFETALADPALRDADWSSMAEVTRKQSTIIAGT